jgi:putative addiction module component (TIGR02574 family)
MPTIKELGIDQMSADERLRLIGEIWDSLSAGEQIELGDEQRAELDRRIAVADADPSLGAPWEKVRARLRSRE